jgi:aminopeptidase YwaD
MKKEHVTSLKNEVFGCADHIIKKFDSRLAGSKESLETADLLEEEMKEFCTTTGHDDFHVFQGAFLGWIRILVVSFLAGIVFLWINQPLVSAALALLSILILIVQFILYLPLLDRLYPKRNARNAYGIIEPLHSVKQQIIISGHHDSAHIFNFFIHQPKWYNMRTTGSIALVISMMVFSVVSFVFADYNMLQIIIKSLLSLSFLIVGQMWFFASKKGTPGAGDNLIASAIALSIGRYFTKENTLSNTRLILASFDAEEEGLRGARAFAKQHESLINEYPTYLLNADCLYHENELFFLTSDLNNTVKLDRELAEDLVQIAADIGVKTYTQDLAFLTGGTDAAELAKKGVHATTIIGMPWTNSNRSAVYHTLNDTLDHVSPKVVENTLEIFINYIEKKDKIIS